MVDQKEQALQGQIQQLRTCRQTQVIAMHSLSEHRTCLNIYAWHRASLRGQPAWNGGAILEVICLVSAFAFMCVMPHRFTVNIDKAHKNDLLSEY